MQHLQKRPNNNFVFGFLASLLASTFGLGMVYVVKFMNNNVSFMQYLEMLKTEAGFRSAILSLALLANIPLVYYIQQRKLYKSFYGIVVVVFGLALIIVLNKLHVLK